MADEPIFEWDPAKAESNLRKHGVTFENSRPVFTDPNAIDRLDETPDHDEERSIIIGMAKGRLLAVVYTERDERVRIISARMADKRECDGYYQNQAPE